METYVVKGNDPVEKIESTRPSASEIGDKAKKFTRWIVADLSGGFEGNVPYTFKDLVWMYDDLKNDNDRPVFGIEGTGAEEYSNWTKSDLRQLFSQMMEGVGRTKFIAAMYYVDDRSSFFSIEKEFTRLLADIDGKVINEASEGNKINNERLEGIIALIERGATDIEKAAAKLAYRRVTGKDYTTSVN